MRVSSEVEEVEEQVTMVQCFEIQSSAWRRAVVGTTMRMMSDIETMMVQVRFDVV